jgi:hypothetical protein
MISQKYLLRSFFFLLAAVGFELLWGQLLRSGTAAKIRVASQSGVMPDGTPLRRQYTNIRALDAYLTTPVVFYDELTRGMKLSHTLLVLSLFSSMQSVSVCMMLCGWRGGKQPWWKPMYVKIV